MVRRPRRRRERAHRDLLVLDVENFHGQKPIQIDAVSYYSLDDRGFVEAHEVDRVEINGKRR